MSNGAMTSEEIEECKKYWRKMAQDTSNAMRPTIQAIQTLGEAARKAGVAFNHTGLMDELESVDGPEEELEKDDPHKLRGKSGKRMLEL